MHLCGVEEGLRKRAYRELDDRGRPDRGGATRPAFDVRIDPDERGRREEETEHVDVGAYPLLPGSGWRTRRGAARGPCARSPIARVWSRRRQEKCRDWTHLGACPTCRFSRHIKRENCTRNIEVFIWIAVGIRPSLSPAPLGLCSAGCNALCLSIRASTRHEKGQIEISLFAPPSRQRPRRARRALAAGRASSPATPTLG
jgi:hypothetical protein